MEQSPTKCPLVEKELQNDKQQKACQNIKRQTKYDDIKLFFLIQMKGFKGSQHRELRNKVLYFKALNEESPFLQEFIESNQQYKETLQSFLGKMDKKQEKIMDDNIQILAFIIQLQTAREIIYKNPIGNQFFSDKNGQEVHTEKFERENKKTSTCEQVEKLQNEFQKKLNCLDQ
ncbi:hypothetical protein PPERSA_03859 [Pseudocohnilembus persalinus]|uniref:Uncharacterized protein n=1 Tax=Pseudocohnilembus persalinus TaxID=266149 RepID=A0A0V0QUH4_PSEPJ|nr:hypothetical protein PPERSA_03859 [Pseudocohnilembus persalinus]|eukprot:KRX05922.1 hypothetical protein PPERSA_03859 [Pseudocohnilembus persalinus]